MPFRLPLPKKFQAEGWKVKIYDQERLEPPHITILHKEHVWRIGLRDHEFLVPPGGTWKEIDKTVRKLVQTPETWEMLCQEWDERYPENPVASVTEEDHGDD